MPQKETLSSAPPGRSAISPYDFTRIDTYRWTSVSTATDHHLVVRLLGIVLGNGFPVNAVRHVDVQVNNIIATLETELNFRSRLGLGMMLQDIGPVLFENRLPQQVQGGPDKPPDLHQPGIPVRNRRTCRGLQDSAVATLPEVVN